MGAGAADREEPTVQTAMAVRGAVEDMQMQGRCKLTACISARFGGLHFFFGGWVGGEGVAVNPVNDYLPSWPHVRSKLVKTFIISKSNLD